MGNITEKEICLSNNSLFILYIHSKTKIIMYVVGIAISNIGRVKKLPYGYIQKIVQRINKVTADVIYISKLSSK